MENLINYFYDSLKQDTIYEHIGEYIKVSTPFLDVHNDCIEFYMKCNANDTIYITDDGYVLNNLDSRGLNFNISPLKKVLKNILSFYNVNIDFKENNSLTITTQYKNFPYKVQSYIQCILALNNFYFLVKNFDTTISESLSENVNLGNNNEEFKSPF